MADEVWLTSHLLLGDHPEGIKDSTRAANANHAAEIVAKGGTARFDLDQEGEARKAMTLMGASPEQIHDAVHFGYTGRFAPGQLGKEAGVGYSGYKVKNRDSVLNALLAAGVPPLYGKVDLDHVTHQYPSDDQAPAVTAGHVVGHVAGNGVQTLVVDLDGSSERPDGGTYHITYSLGAGHQPVESNALLASAKAIKLAVPIPLELSEF